MIIFQGKLELVTGAASGSMVLEIYNKDDKLVCTLDNDDALLGSYQIDDGMRLHVSLFVITSFENSLFLSIPHLTVLPSSG